MGDCVQCLVHLGGDGCDLCAVLVQCWCDLGRELVGDCGRLCAVFGAFGWAIWWAIVCIWWRDCATIFLGQCHYPVP